MRYVGGLLIANELTPWRHAGTHQPICATYETAPCTRGILDLILARHRVLTRVRTHDAASRLPRAHMVFEGRIQVKTAYSKAFCCTLVLPISFRVYCAKLLLTPRCCRPEPLLGTSRSQAAKSQVLWKVRGGGARTTTPMAINGPMPRCHMGQSPHQSHGFAQDLAQRY